MVYAEAAEAETLIAMPDEAIVELEEADIPDDEASAEVAGIDLGEALPEKEEAGLVANDVPADGIRIDEACFPDATFRTYVKENFDADGDGALSGAEREAVTEIDVSDRGIASLEGIGLFVNLWNLNCEDNRLARLDVSD